jgi:hypothetical protein
MDAEYITAVEGLQMEQWQLFILKINGNHDAPFE